MNDRRGFALITALWFLVAISALGLQLSISARERRMVAINVSGHAQAAAAARAGLEHAQAHLDRRLRPGATVPTDAPLDPWRGVERVFADTVSLGTERYLVSLEDPGARVHLNLATQEELRRLFVALRVDGGQADRLAQAIVDWRDPDDFRHARGAEREEYLQAGLPTIPRNGPFRSVSELRGVMGMTSLLLSRVERFLTVLGTGRVDLSSAPREVLLTLPGMSDEAVAVLMSRRRPDRVMTLDELVNQLSPGPRALLEPELPMLVQRTTTQRQELVITSNGWVDGGGAHSTAVGLVVRVPGAALMVWRRGE